MELLDAGRWKLHESFIRDALLPGWCSSQVNVLLSVSEFVTNHFTQFGVWMCALQLVQVAEYM
jgi:hypothetical protein